LLEIQNAIGAGSARTSPPSAIAALCRAVVVDIITSSVFNK